MAISFLLLFVLCILTVPIAYAVGISALGGLLLSGYPLQLVAQRMFTQADSFSLMAIPFFILAGNLMDKGGISNKLVNLSTEIVGQIRGGLAMVCVLACMLFGAISGSGAAASAAIGAVLFPALCEAKYDKPFSTALIATSGPLGIVIPPSIVMVVYATSANVSVGNLFLAGYIPGILLGIGIMVHCYFYAKALDLPKGKKPTCRSFLKALFESIWAIFLVVIIMGGILGGFFTATEASVVAVIYAAIVGKVVYKGLTLKNTKELIISSAKTTAAIMFCIATTNILAWGLTAEQIISGITEFLLGFSESKVVILLLVNVILLFLGTILDATPAIILTVPILLPVITKLGIDPVHFGIIVTMNFAIGMSTPPVGVTLFVSSSLTKTPITQVVKPMIPIWIILFTILLVVTFVPEISLFLPRLFG
ncbi:MAG: TRAP transporter large permease [Sphaerochaetaceae bacterium]|nr:TRAP transporter large permease [Sphaerochaetaceae bacterium]